jgi:hypothetical protein
VTESNDRERHDHVEPLFAALRTEKRAGSMGWKLVWVVVAVVALTLLVAKQAF